VIGLVAEGCTNKEISVRLSIAVRTVEKHRREGSECIGARCTADLVRYALDSGLKGSTFHTFSK
jgi:DNA-binding NarL/FixJ family response regulator